MKITREEFKEFAALYENAWNNFDKYADIIDSNFLDGLMFPLFSWLDEKLNLRNEVVGSYVLEDITWGEGPTDWDKAFDEYVPEEVKE